MARLLSNENLKPFGTTFCMSLIVLTIVLSENLLVEWFSFAIYLIVVTVLTYVWRKDMLNEE